MASENFKHPSEDEVIRLINEGDLIAKFRQAMALAYQIPEHMLQGEPSASEGYSSASLQERSQWTEVIIQSSRPVRSDSICQNCRNYHGQSYGGSWLHCGFHAYGHEDPVNCPDFNKR